LDGSYESNDPSTKERCDGFIDRKGNEQLVRVLVLKNGDNFSQGMRTLVGW
jgi:hypothetical protein